jgi:hypothetical protein
MEIDVMDLVFVCMKGISIIHDETRKKRYVQIDMALIENDRELLEGYLDALLIESRKNEPSIPLEKVRGAPEKGETVSYIGALA